MKVNLVDALKFPLKDKKLLKKLFLGGILSVIPFFSGGYLLRIMKAAIAKQKPVLPEWDDWKGIFNDGIWFVIIILAYTIAYLFVPVLIGLLIKYKVIVCFVNTILLTALPLVFLPAIFIGLCLYTGTSQISSAFQVKKIIEIFKKGLNEYIVISIILVLTVVIVNSVFRPLFWLWPFGGFYLSVVMTRLYSEIFIKTVEEVEESPMAQVKPKK